CSSGCSTDCSVDERPDGCASRTDRSVQRAEAAACDRLAVRMTAKARLFFPAFAIALVADQATKLWIDASLGFADRIEVISGFFYITHVRNPGAAFGLLN